MQHDDNLRFTPGAKLFHWVTVALLAAQITLGWTMDDARRNVPPSVLNDLHMSFGMVLLAMTMLRLGWRIIDGVPRSEPGTPAWQAAAANLLHLSLYALIILFALTGWANATFHGWPIRIFGVVPLPKFLPAWTLLRSFAHIHNWLVWILLAAIAGHAVAALWHHFVVRDRTLRRMLPENFGGAA